MAELETLKEQIADTLGCPRTPDGFCYCEMCQTKYWWKADTIIAEVNRRLEKSALTPEQIWEAQVGNSDWDDKDKGKAIAAAQLKATKEKLK